MLESDSDAPNWSPIEIRLFNTLDVFQHKPIIMKKAEAKLNSLKQALILELSRTYHPYPPDTDTTNGQIVRGENHKGFPFISLDMPQMFTKSHMFTYRTLFWWGHDLIFSLILKQTNHIPIINKLMELKNSPKWENVYLATSPSPWEWENHPDKFISISNTSNSKIKRTINSLEYIKLCCFHPLNDPAFPKLNWENTGLTTWKKISMVCVV